MGDRNFTREDMLENKMIAAAGYVVFFVPLIWRPKSRLGRYCANQGLLLAIVQLIVTIFFNILGGIPLLGWLFGVVGGLVRLGIFVVSLMLGAMLLTTGSVTELPYIGYLRLIPDVEP